jgi:hypothetical protein
LAAVSLWSEEGWVELTTREPRFGVGSSSSFDFSKTTVFNRLLVLLLLCDSLGELTYRLYSFFSFSSVEISFTLSSEGACTTFRFFFLITQSRRFVALGEDFSILDKIYEGF